MFSANENIVLRQHKRRIIQFVEETIPDDVLDQGTNVLVMQISCRAPGCVPLETVITVVFPTKQSVLPGLVLTKHETTFQTKILMPMADVTKEDVLEALPPAFQGGLQTMATLGLRARDVMLAQITQLFDDVESRKLMAQYLQQTLQDYLDRDCEAPEYGQQFPALPSKPETATPGKVATVESTTISNDNASSTTMQSIYHTSGNIVVRRVLDEDGKVNTTDEKNAAITSIQSTAAVVTHAPTPLSSANDWRQHQAIDRQISNAMASASLLARLEHAPGVRQPSCPCCDPDSPSNYVDTMMML